MKSPLSFVAADVRRLCSISDFGFRILKMEPPHVGCYGLEEEDEMPFGNSSQPSSRGRPLRQRETFLRRSGIENLQHRICRRQREESLIG